MSNLLTIWDIILPPFYLVLIYFISNNIKNKNIEKNPVYKYYLPGMWIKIIGGIVITFIYVFYYKGGDTTEYFKESKLVGNLLFTDPSDFFRILFIGVENQFSIVLSSNAVLSSSYGGDHCAFFFIRLITPLSLLSFQSYIVTVVLLAWIAYTGIWKLYLMFVQLYPHLYKQLAISILFIPSVVFWGSGLLKDTITMSATALFTYNFYYFFISYKKNRLHIYSLILMAFLLISIKPYIFIAITPACLIWLSLNKIMQIKNIFIRFVTMPFIILIGVLISFGVVSLLGENLGQYSSSESIIAKAQITQQELVRGEQYGKNYYDIGKFDNSFYDIISKIPKAIIAGLYRPFLWDAKNFVVVLAGIENIVLLFFSLFALIMVGPIKVLQYIIKEPLIFFSLVFTIIFAFSVGLTTANYGALVRYRIPELPFFASSLIIIFYQYYFTKNKKTVK